MEFHYTVKTSKSIQETFSSLEENLKSNKFGVLWHLDLTAKLNEKGVDSFTRPFHILEVCNPVEAAKVLSVDPIVGYFLPCKIAVYESDGETAIGLPKPSALVSMLDNDELKQIASEIEKTLIGVLDQSI
ncbi:uncharacterized protein SAMN05877753_11112 [Bacillus oleivorans]|uniref:DUF302 domain-containing protein n=1 Tax=Bacillus oleivorans TaxID=1448271 RepID=A0A285D5N6_9BACI|nr:DUF302 domain-containing protein [Bacillus oleivorans]SNX75120.1 uncharacterized protein SAMN05877753_11112 [Bacillus oleivorans]